MPRLRHFETGVVVSVADDSLSRLGAEWVPVEPVQRPVVESIVRPTTARRKKITS